jgi:3-oxoacyl-[acyl-carrier protein] reductase
VRTCEHGASSGECVVECIQYAESPWNPVARRLRARKFGSNVCSSGGGQSDEPRRGDGPARRTARRTAPPEENAIETPGGRLAGRVAIVTGAASGIGRATARRFAAEGAHVVALDLREPETPPGGLALGCDITDERDVEAAVAEAKARFGHIDVLAHFAGITKDALAHKMTLQQWEDVIRVNLTGSFVVAQAVARAMEDGGSIVLTSSRSWLGNVGQANYSASKGGVVSLARTLALELGRRRIRVNALAPGFIETPMTDVVPDKVREKAVTAIPLGRIGQPEEIAAVALFFASDESSYVSGQTLLIDGGRSVGVGLV